MLIEFHPRGDSGENVDSQDRGRGILVGRNGNRGEVDSGSRLRLRCSDGRHDDRRRWWGRSFWDAVFVRRRAVRLATSRRHSLYGIRSEFVQLAVVQREWAHHL